VSAEIGDQPSLTDKEKGMLNGPTRTDQQDVNN
jgi:hypothetical protein